MLAGFYVGNKLHTDNQELTMMDFDQFVKVCSQRGFEGAVFTKQRSVDGGYEFTAQRGRSKMMYHTRYGWVRHWLRTSH